MRKLKISRILILFVVLILVVTASIYCIRTFFRQDEIIEEKSYYDLDLFSMENGWMTYKDSSYKSLTGIDVSSHNQYIDWYSVKQDGIDFAMLRVGYRGAQEGILHEDAYFNTNMQAAIQNKIKVGAYFFSSAITEDEIDEEVNMVLNEIRNYKIDMPIVFDMEEFEKGGRIDNLTQEQRTNLALRFCGKIKKAGYDPMIYGNMTWLYQNYDFEKISKYPIWVFGIIPVFYEFFSPSFIHEELNTLTQKRKCMILLLILLGIAFIIPAYWQVIILTGIVFEGFTLLKRKELVKCQLKKK